MDKLPQEVLKMIIDEFASHNDFISRLDLRCLRSTSKKLAAAVAPPLFEALPLWIGISSSDNLSKISTHCQLSQYVTKIIFSPLRFVNPNPKSQAPYYPNIRNRLEQETDSLSTLELTFGKYISSYQRHIVAQNHLTCNSADFKITARAFKKLPQLGEIVVNHSNDYIGAEAIMKDFVLLTGDELTFDGEYTISKLTLALAAASVRPSYLKFGGDPKSATTAREEPAQDKNSRYKLDFRSPSHSRMTVMGSINSFPELYTYGPEPWAACLGDLQKLDIDLMNFQEAEYGQMLLTARTLGTIVENARNSIKNVNVEELSDRDAEVGTVITTKWEDLFGTHPVTRLRKLET